MLLRDQDMRYLGRIVEVSESANWADVEPYLTRVCPECEKTPADDATEARRVLEELGSSNWRVDGYKLVRARATAYQQLEHAEAHAWDLGGHVLIGCEGYHIINPNILGIESTNWSDWRDTIGFTEAEWDQFADQIIEKYGLTKDAVEQAALQILEGRQKPLEIGEDNPRKGQDFDWTDKDKEG